MLTQSVFINVLKQKSYSQHYATYTHKHIVLTAIFQANLGELIDPLIFSHPYPEPYSSQGTQNFVLTRYFGLYRVHLH